MKELHIAAVSFTIGLSLGLIGAGGSILTIPAFVYILRIDPLTSAVYSMFVVGACSLVGGIRSLYSRLVDLRVAALFGIASILGVLASRRAIFPLIPDPFVSFAGLRFSKSIVFMLCLSLLMFMAAVRILRPSREAPHKNLQPGDRKPGRLVLQGLVVGLITGLLGIGGGFLIVPALHLWARLPMKNAIGTTLLIIAVNSLFSFLNSYATVAIDWGLLAQFCMGSTLGILIGSLIGERVSGNGLRRIFGWFVLGISFFIVFKQFFL
jgi:uncharacterized protein